MSTRDTEKLIALYKYELEHGVGPAESLQEVWELVYDLVLDGPELPPDDAPEDVKRKHGDLIWDRCSRAGVALLRMLCELGDGDHVAQFIEDLAVRRSRCDAKFGVARVVPLSDTERHKLAAEWDADEAESRRRRREEEESATEGGSSAAIAAISKATKPKPKRPVAAKVLRRSTPSPKAKRSRAAA